MLQIVDDNGCLFVNRRFNACHACRCIQPPQVEDFRQVDSVRHIESRHIGKNFLLLCGLLRFLIFFDLFVNDGDRLVNDGDDLIHLILEGRKRRHVLTLPADSFVVEGFFQAVQVRLVRFGGLDLVIGVDSRRVNLDLFGNLCFQFLEIEKDFGG